LSVEDNVITLNATYSGPYNVFDSGIEVNLGGGTYASLIWDSSESLWAVGLSGSESTIITEAGVGLTKSGSNLSIDFNSVTGTGLTQNGSVISIDTIGFASTLAGAGLSANGGTLSVNVGNGLSLDSDIVILGGTLSQLTVIEASGNDFTIGNFDNLSFTGSNIDIELDPATGLFLLDSNQIDLYGENLTIITTDDIDINTSTLLTLSFATSSVVDISGASAGLVYAGDYSAGFLDNSLVTKKYVDSVSSLINVDNGIQELSPSVIGLGGTLSQNTNINGDSNDLAITDVSIFAVYATGSSNIRLESTNDSVNKGYLEIGSTGAFLETDSSGSYSYIAAEQTQVYLEAYNGSSQSYFRMVMNVESVSDTSTDNSMIILDNISKKGLVYSDDYTANFTDNSLVTKQYVDSVSSTINVDNGIQELSPGVIGLGGTLSQNTTINSENNNLTLQNFNILTLTGSLVDIQLDNGLFLVDAGSGGSVDLYGGDVTIYATGSFDVISTNEFTISAGTASVTTSNLEGLVYTTDYSTTFVNNSLITKQYVDTGTSSIWSYINGLSANTSGTSGTSGESGTSGTSGESGTSGTSGTSGESGTSGTSGTSGESGTSGTSGTSGESGTSGTSGESGTSGTSGESGTSGTSGESGTSGTSGTGFNTISNFADNRILTSNNDSNSATAESNLTFDGNILSVYGDLVVAGSFTVSGTSSVINTQNLFVQDPIILLAGTQTGTPILDSGLFINRGSGQTQSFIWDESNDEFALASTNDSSTVIGNVNISEYSNLKLNQITGSYSNFTYTNITTSTFSEINTDWIDFTLASQATGIGRLAWNSDFNSLYLGLTGGNVNLVVGQDTTQQVFNAESTTLNKGEVVYIFGAQGDKISVKRASNLSDVTSAKTFGVVADTTIASGAIGYVTSTGVVKGLNLSTYNTGDILWLGATAGTYQVTKPQAPNHIVFVGVVLRNNAGNGLLYVKPQNGYELDEIHDVLISGTANNDLLAYESSTGLWKNKTTGSLNIATGSGTTNYVPRWLSSNNLSSTSSIWDNGTNVGIGITTSTFAKLHVNNTGSSYSLLVDDSTYPDSTPFVIDASGSIGIGTMSTASSKVTIVGTSSVLNVVGSVTNSTVFEVNGVSGQLFSINDSLTGSLFSVNDISGLPILEVFSDSTTIIGDYVAPSLYTTKKYSIGTSLTNIYSFPTASYDGAFVDYTIKNGVNSRSGNLMATWNGSSIQYTESSTLDIGTTSGFTFSFAISGTYGVLRGQASTNGWTVKTIIRSI
jgi:hypothetical protein